MTTATDMVRAHNAKLDRLHTIRLRDKAQTEIHTASVIVATDGQGKFGVSDFTIIAHNPQRATLEGRWYYANGTHHFTGEGIIDFTTLTEWSAR
jgi:hypothetical protein